MSCALAALAWLAAGYGTFRVWVRLRPPERVSSGRGAVEWCLGGTEVEVGVALWASLLVWPAVIVGEGAWRGFRWAHRMLMRGVLP